MIDVIWICVITALILIIFNYYIYYVDIKKVNDNRKRILKFEQNMKDFIDVVDAKEGLHDKRLIELEKKVEVDSKYTLKLCCYPLWNSRFLYDRFDKHMLSDVTHTPIVCVNKSYRENRCLELCETPKEED